MTRRLGLLLLIGPLLTAAVLVSAAAAHARDSLSTVASTLRATSVYVDPDISNPAWTLTDDQADALSTQIAETGVPTYVAVMTAATAGTAEPSDALTAVYGAVGADGVYAVVVDGRFRASSTGERADDVEAMATAAANANRGDLPGALQDFVGRVGEAYGTGSGVPTNPASALVPLGIGAAVLGGGGYWLYRRSKAATAARTAEVRRTLDEDVTAYGELVAGLDTDDPQLAGEGQRDAQQALDAYEKAKASAAAMSRPDDARTVTEALEEGRYHLACVEARRHGTPLPERRPPCFVDPRHGPSTQDVEWAPDGGTARPVPVCAACATQLAQGELPAAREVEVSGRRMPYWRAGGAYQPYATGYYSNFDGVLPAILIGSMMGGMMGGGGFGGAPAASDAGTDAGGGWGGGWGGGDFGAGGGGLGGGDFGGGGDF